MDSPGRRLPGALRPHEARDPRPAVRAGRPHRGRGVRRLRGADEPLRRHEAPGRPRRGRPRGGRPGRPHQAAAPQPRARSSRSPTAGSASTPPVSPRPSWGCSSTWRGRTLRTQKERRHDRHRARLPDLHQRRRRPRLGRHHRVGVEEEVLPRHVVRRGPGGRRPLPHRAPPTAATPSTASSRRCHPRLPGSPAGSCRPGTCSTTPRWPRSRPAGSSGPSSRSASVSPASGSCTATSRAARSPGPTSRTAGSGCSTPSRPCSRPDAPCRGVDDDHDTPAPTPADGDWHRRQAVAGQQRGPSPARGTPRRRPRRGAAPAGVRRGVPLGARDAAAPPPTTPARRT